MRVKRKNEFKVIIEAVTRTNEHALVFEGNTYVSIDKINRELKKFAEQTTPRSSAFNGSDESRAYIKEWRVEEYKEKQSVPNIDSIMMAGIIRVLLNQAPNLLCAFGGKKTMCGGIPGKCKCGSRILDDECMSQRLVELIKIFITARKVKKIQNLKGRCYQ